MKDILIIGSGPAGLSAALNAKIRNKDVVVSGGIEGSHLYRAKKVDNYIGFVDISGREMLENFRTQAEKQGVEFLDKRVLNIMPFGEEFMVNCENDILMCRAVIICSGMTPVSKYPGEEEFLGRGVSYCATCDGMLYSGKKVVVIGKEDAVRHEMDYLKDIGCEAEHISDKNKKIEIIGDDKARMVKVGERTIECEGIFVLRESVAPKDFLPELEIIDGYIKADNRQMTNINGVFAAGDCVGKPFQVSKAAGEGQAAALFAVEYLDTKGK